MNDPHVEPGFTVCGGQAFILPDFVETRDETEISRYQPYASNFPHSQVPE